VLTAALTAVLKLTLLWGLTVAASQITSAVSAAAATASPQATARLLQESRAATARHFQQQKQHQVQARLMQLQRVSQELTRQHCFTWATVMATAAAVVMVLLCLAVQHQPHQQQ
jgi:hypothetical protein